MNFRNVMAAVAAVLLLSGVVATSAHACTATVRGLSSTYNPATGSGFLALRAGPGTRNPQIGEAFNGERYRVLGVRGGWVKIEALDGELWAFGRYLRRSPRGCRG